MTALVLRRARLVGRSDRTRDVLIEDGRLAGFDVGDVPDAEVVDLDGRFVGPGLWDAHVHMDQWAQQRQRVDLSGTHSPGAVVERFAARLEGEDDATAPLVGYGFRDALWTEPAHRALLDRLGSTRPIVAMSGDLHSVWLNGVALEHFGAGAHETGVLREAAAIDVVMQVDAVPADVLDGWVADAAQAAARRGVVGIVELEWADNLAQWTRRARGRALPLRVRCGIYSEHLDAAIEDGRRTGAVISGTGGLVEVGPLKAITDGSLNTRTALCHAPYPGSEASDHPCGVANLQPDALVALMRRAARNGIIPAIHAIGDRANAIVLDAFEEVGCGGAIEHAQLVDERDFARFGSLGIVASVQPEHAVDDRDVADRLWSGRTGRAFAYRSLLDAGARLALGSDAPVAPLDPWVTMAAAVGRSRDGREPWHPEQALTVAEAYAASTPAGLDLKVGGPADLVVIERDPLTATSDELRILPVAGTLLSGAWTHRLI